MTIGSFLGLLWRRRLVVALLVVLLGALGVLYSASRPATYSAQSVVNVTPVTTGLSAGASTKDISTITEVKVVTSTSVARLAADDMHYTGGASQLLKHVTATSPLDSQVVVISFSSADADRAAQGANAFADAYLQYRQDTTEQVIARRAEKLDTRIAAVRRQVTAAGAAASAAAAGSSDREEAAALQRALQNQVNTLLSQQNALLTVAVAPGEVISRATTPSAAGVTSKLVYPVAGVLFGFILGALLALVLDRRDDRVRSAEDVAETTGAPVLADVVVRRRRGAERGAAPALAAPGSGEQEGYRVLAAKLLASSVAGQRSVLVTAPPSGVPAGGAGALNLAVSLGAPAVRVAFLTTADGMAVAAEQLRLPADSTWATWPAQLVAVPSQPHLSLLSLGDEVALGSLDLAAVARQLEAFEVVVVDGLALRRESSTFALARLVRSAVVLVEEGRTRAAELERWTEQLAQVGLVVEGEVMLRQRRRPSGVRGTRSAGSAPTRTPADRPATATAMAPAPAAPAPAPAPAAPAAGATRDELPSHTGDPVGQHTS
ncbi:capsular polysaccharide biosynthesis protein [Motilibacter peucedani]|uniref:Capsular polysaccharide biosynthesis protein n=1 Tax=Motilibacter peucedani TaxID=598650 RepID=A0A420XLN5_9ACTN|nr:capsular polysaccharide biosynthesis protein [Motilibacter peucedani]